MDDTLLANARPIPCTPFRATRSSLPVGAHRRFVLGPSITEVDDPICTQMTEQHAEIYHGIDKVATQYERGSTTYTEGAKEKCLTADEQEQVVRWIDQEITRAKHPGRNKQSELNPRLKADATKRMAALDSFREEMMETKDAATSANDAMPQKKWELEEGLKALEPLAALLWDQEAWFDTPDETSVKELKAERDCLRAVGLRSIAQLIRLLELEQNLVRF